MPFVYHVINRLVYLSTSCGRENGGWFVGHDLVCGVWSTLTKTSKGHLRRWGARQGAEVEIKCCMMVAWIGALHVYHNTTKGCLAL